jgi:hypothetical protein
MKLKVGDRVVINAFGLIAYEGYARNPRGIKGTISDVDDYYYVTWDNGDKNVYAEDTLSLARPKMLENE